MVGAAIATLIPNPLISLPLSLASHFITDYIPHWNPHINTELKSAGKISTRSKIIIMADSGLALMVGTIIASHYLPDTNRFIVMLMCCFLAVSPDVAEIPYYFLGMKKVHWISRLISWQRTHQWNVAPIWGFLAQLIVIVVSALLIYRFSF